ncbi:MAG: hypothetical protein EBT99_17485, partial [Betaproteobacteria bacterium]|nr:hypothetical protein [Betaproteobacteria bacterium]
MNKNIRDFFASNPTEQQARDAMDQYLVTEEDLRRATGKGFADFFPPTGALPVASTGTSGDGLPVSRDEAQQTAIDAATVKPAEAVGTYRGVPIPTFTDKYIDRGDEGTQILSAAD